MFDLSTFYQSREWRGLLAQLKTERINDDGFIVCEYCGKPIVKAYDIIGHHKTELTPENVNDVFISLNPDNVSLVHHRCHNYIHNKLGHTERQVFLVYGAPLSGKSRWVRENMNAGDFIVDINNIWESISGSAYEKPNRLKSIAFKLRDVEIEAVKYRLGKWKNAYICGGYPIRSERERLCRELGAREVFIEASKEDCLERMKTREEVDKALLEEYIEQWFERFSPSE
jgi:predicted kinase